MHWNWQFSFLEACEYFTLSKLSAMSQTDTQVLPNVVPCACLHCSAPERSLKPDLRFFSYFSSGLTIAHKLHGVTNYLDYFSHARCPRLLLLASLVYQPCLEKITHDTFRVVPKYDFVILELGKNQTFDNISKECTAF